MASSLLGIITVLSTENVKWKSLYPYDLSRVGVKLGLVVGFIC
jgi:hypothetical protein